MFFCLYYVLFLLSNLLYLIYKALKVLFFGLIQSPVKTKIADLSGRHIFKIRAGGDALSS